MRDVGAHSSTADYVGLHCGSVPILGERKEVKADWSAIISVPNFVPATCSSCGWLVRDIEAVVFNHPAWQE